MNVYESFLFFACALACSPRTAKQTLQFWSTNLYYKRSHHLPRRTTMILKSRYICEKRETKNKLLLLNFVNLFSITTIFYLIKNTPPTLLALNTHLDCAVAGRRHYVLLVKVNHIYSSPVPHQHPPQVYVSWRLHVPNCDGPT